MAKSKPAIKIPPYQEIFESLGVIFNHAIGDERIANCPFCNHEPNKFGLNITTGQWQCWSKNTCGREGNLSTFYKQYYEEAYKETTEYEYYQLANYRKLPVSIFPYCGIACKDNTYILPVRNAFGGITDIRQYEIGKKFYSLPEGVLYPLGLRNLLDSNRATEKVYLCGGEFKYFALTWLLKILKLPGIPIGTFGEIFKKEWIPYFANRELVACHDNDVAGEKGIEKIAASMNGQLSTYQFVNWPNEFPSGYDVDAFISAYGVLKEDPKECWEQFNKLIIPYKSKAVVELEIQEKVHEIEKDIPDVLTLDDVIKEYAEVLDLNDDLIWIIKICLATVLSTKLPGSKKNPVWVLIVGPPGFAKTEIILTFSEAKSLCHYESTLKRTTLISGFNQGGKDSSIIPLLNNKCLMLKDYTEILDANPQDQKDIFAVLRGGFDGEVKHTFGNGAVRNYKSRWSCVAGVTKAIQKHSQASVGERFLRYFMDTKGVDWEEQQRKALYSDLFGTTERTRLFAVVKKFLNQAFDFSVENVKKVLSPEYERRISILARLGGHLQTPVERHESGSQYQQVIYDPEQNSGNRMYVQLTKLAISLCILDKRECIDEIIYNLIKKMMFDTVYGYHVKILNYMVNSDNLVTKPQLHEQLKISMSTINRHIDDMILLKLIEAGPIIKVNDKAFTSTYKMVQEVRELWVQI